jgi:Protein of unknown function (DUF3179)
MNTKRFMFLLVSLTLILSACVPAIEANTDPGTAVPPVEEDAPPPVAEEAPSQSSPTETTTEAMSEEPPAPELDLMPGQQPPGGAGSEFSTDFNKTIISYDDVLSGGPPKDGIPPIDQPTFVSVEEADAWLADVEPVVLVEAGNVAKAYPLQILMWHEIVNDSVDGVPLSITFCPLCNTAIAFERTLDEQVLDFGTTGRLRYSNLIMYDRQTETWWQQASGQAITGELTGSQLVFYPAVIIAWQDFQQTYPQGEVLSRDTGYGRPYGQNPYTGYDDINKPPFLYDGPPTPGELLPMARVLTIDLDSEAVAYSYGLLQELGVLNDEIAGQPVAIFWQPGTASALDTGAIAQGRDVGTAAAFLREVDSELLSFTSVDGKIIDSTGKEWDLFGRSTAGEQLTPVVAVNHFWFSWAAFRPETRVYQP